MTHQSDEPASGDNDHTQPPPGTTNSAGTDDDDMTDEEFMQLVAQVNAEAAAAEDTPQTRQEESK